MAHKTIKYLIPILSVLIIANACRNGSAETSQIILDNRYENVITIEATSDCKGPRGNYISTMKSLSDGGFYFSQDYEYKDTPLRAKVDSNNEGFFVDSRDSVTDTLPKTIIEMLRCHEFHRMHMNPTHFFSDIAIDKYKDGDLICYKALDRLSNPVLVYYSSSEKRIESVHLRSSLDTTQQIEILFKHWTKSEYGPLVDQVEIVQAKKDTFQFNYKDLMINSNLIF